MKKRPHPLLYLLGKILGQPLAWVLRKQKGLALWLVSKGIPLKLTKLILIVANAFLLITLLLAILPAWMIAIVIILAVIAFVGIDIDTSASESRYEYRGGTDGSGTYDNQLGCRVDCGSIEDEDSYNPKN